MLHVKKAVAAKLGVPVEQQQLFLHSKVRCCLLMTLWLAIASSLGGASVTTAANTSADTEPEQI